MNHFLLLVDLNPYSETRYQATLDDQWAAQVPSS